MTKLLLVMLGLAAASCSDGEAQSRSAAAEASPAAAKVELAGRVTDAAGILGPREEASLSALLAGFKKATQHQMVVVTVPTLEGEDIAAFTRTLANA